MQTRSLGTPLCASSLIRCSRLRLPNENHVLDEPASVWSTDCLLEIRAPLRYRAKLKRAGLIICSLYIFFNKSQMILSHVIQHTYLHSLYMCFIQDFSNLEIQFACIVKIHIFLQAGLSWHAPLPIGPSVGTVVTRFQRLPI
jgi:hypothetical protein